MSNIIQVLEYGTLRINEVYQGVTFEKRHWKQLARYQGAQPKRRYLDVLHDGVRFRSYVGVIQSGNLTIEILPKVDDVDDASGADLRKWRNVLLHMLRESGMLRLDSLSNALLREKENSLLDVYLDLFLTEVEALLHRGLVKRYRHTEGQQMALRGAIQFGTHLARNLVHQERFYTRHQTYDHQHLHNRLIRQALLLLPRLTNSPSLRGRTARALLQWSESPPLKVTAATFAKLTFDRKTEAYRPAMVIARLLLLNHRPDLRGGSNDLVALVFNMNTLWEQWVLKTLQRLYTPLGWTVIKPGYTTLWKADDDTVSEMQPDILLTIPQVGNIVLDAKWKRPKGQPDGGDLRQLFAYAHHYDAAHTMLLYPHTATEYAVKGRFQLPAHLSSVDDNLLVTCGTIFIQVGAEQFDSSHVEVDDEGYLCNSLGTQFKQWLPQHAE